MAERFADKVVLVTGAASGIGRASAELFAQEGAAVVAADLDEVGVAAVVASIEAQGGRAIAAVGDVSTAADVDRIVECAMAAYGRVDALAPSARRPEVMSVSGLGRSGLAPHPMTSTA